MACNHAHKGGETAWTAGCLIGARLRKFPRLSLNARPCHKTRVVKLFSYLRKTAHSVLLMMAKSQF